MFSVATRTAVEDHEVGKSECWCCGTVDDPDRMVHLGNHPEVTLCVRCGYSVAKQAGAIDDRTKTGPLVIARNRFRPLRTTVMQHGWHRNRFIGRPLRWIGRRLP